MVCFPKREICGGRCILLAMGPLFFSWSCNFEIFLRSRMPGSFGDDISCYLPYQELHSWFGFVDWVNCGVIATSNFYLHNVLQWVWGTWSSPIHVDNGRATGAIIEYRYCQWSSWRSFLCQLFGMILCLVALWDKCCGDLLIFASTFELLNLVVYTVNISWFVISQLLFAWLELF